MVEVLKILPSFLSKKSQEKTFYENFKQNLLFMFLEF